jgi:hypothetical protein
MAMTWVWVFDPGAGPFLAAGSDAFTPARRPRCG